MKITLPNFLVIGAGKSGTTSLYEYLNSHPEIFMSPVKETNFFALEGEQILDAEADPNQMKHYPWSITDIESYKNLFNDVEGEKAVGEVSPMYLYSEKAALNIKKMIPNVKLIAILRQPTERLYSRYLHLARENRVPTTNFRDALNRESIWWKRNDLVQEGFYYTHLRKYYELFPSKNIHVILHDDFRNDPIKVMQGIYSFLGVNEQHIPDMSDKFNVSGFIANKNIDRLIGQNSIIKKVINTVSPSLYKSITENKAIRSRINNWRNKNLRRPPLTRTLKNQINEVYENEIIAVQNIINRDLSHWLTK